MPDRTLGSEVGAIYKCFWSCSSAAYSAISKLACVVYVMFGYGERIDGSVRARFTTICCYIEVSVLVRNVEIFNAGMIFHSWYCALG